MVKLPDLRVKQPMLTFINIFSLMESRKSLESCQNVIYWFGVDIKILYIDLALILLQVLY